MAIDFLICGLLFISFTINLLPLGAFWVTPGLRTTASRFVINLLIINLIGCCILAPTLFLNGNLSIETNKNSLGNSVELHRLVMMQEQDFTDDYSRNVSKRSHSSTFQCNSTYCVDHQQQQQQQQLTIEEQNEKIVISEVNEEYLNNVIASDRSRVKYLQTKPMMRCWSIDLAAALGALSVLLVVGDTWMAVRDPLRYHTRISGVKSWILIAMTWMLGILFGLISALREINFQCRAVIERKFYSFPWQIELSSITTSTVFSMVFACIYFIVIILLPFGFVCGMYWRIVSEAKENGVRIRKNGSSPLLQSSMNLNVHRNSLTSASPQSGGGLHMQIDRKRNRKDSMVKIAEVKKLKTQASKASTLPPLSEPEENLSGEEECSNIPRPLSSGDAEYSMRQIPLIRQSSHDLGECSRFNSFRQIKSSPNFQKYYQTRRGSLNSFDTSVHNHQHQHRSNAAQALPNSMSNTSPKTLSYMSSIRRRLSNASSLFKQREETRAARISILVVIMFLVSYLPYGLLVLLQGPVIENFPYSTQLAVFMILLANLISPFIFAYRNKQVRHGVTRLFGLDSRSKEHRLQRNGIFLRYGTKARISVRRSSSKVSAYSMSSCKYLTPILKHTNRNLRNKNEQNKLKRTNTFPSNNAQETSCSQKSPQTLRPVKSDNINIVDTTIDIQPDECNEKFSIFKIFCKNSRTSNCAPKCPIEV